MPNKTSCRSRALLTATTLQIGASAIIGLALAGGVHAASLSLPASGLTVQAVSGTSVQLHWQDNASNETGYLIMRRTTRGADGFARVAQVGANTTSYTDSGLNNGWEYDYEIIALAAPSNIASLQVLAPPLSGAVAPASSLTASVLSPTSVKLNWHDNANNESGYLIMRRATRGADGFAQVGQVGAKTTSYTDSGLNNGWEYDYEIIATGAASNATPSNIASLQVVASGPAPTPGPTPTSAPTSTPAPNPTPATGPTTDVRAYGVACNGATDDTYAIQAAINAAAVGNTVVFPAGTCIVSLPLSFHSNINYYGQGTVLKATMQDDIAYTDANAAANITITGLTFDGGGLQIPGENIAGKNLHITGNTFQNIHSSSSNWPTRSGIFVGGAGITNSSIDHNHLSNIYEVGSMDSENDYMAAGMVLFNLTQTSVSDNTFDMVYQGISSQYNCDNTKGTHPGILIARNTFTHLHRMGVELQGCYTQGLTVEENNINNYYKPYYNSFGLSIVVDGGSNTIVQNNFVAAYPVASFNTSQGARYGEGIELGGDHMLVTGNTVEGAWAWNTASIVIGNAPQATVKNNIVCNSGGNVAVSYEVQNVPGTVISPNTILSTCP